MSKDTGDRRLDPSLEEIEIVQHIKANANYLYNNICGLYKVCKGILSQIPKEFSNYTQHDIEHSIHVIKYMNDFVKDHLADFSNLHLAIMVYVALLHDVGMYVSDDEIIELNTLFENSVRGFKDWTHPEKTAYLQDYIRENHGKRVRSMLDASINSATKIRSLLFVGETRSYDLSDIVSKICQAHMENTKWISRNLRQKEVYGTDAFYPQLIAVFLRIGDLLDIDDRRAPYSLYVALKPLGYSDGEWRKHLCISNYDKVLKNGDNYIIEFWGSCDDFQLYQKIRNYIDHFSKWLKDDVELCSNYYELKVSIPEESIHIETIGFEATPLRFHLDYERVIKLLMGERIYDSKRDGLRELIQNSIDAVLLMKHREEKNPFSDYRPSIGIKIQKESNRIIVFDNGVGMSEDILFDYFFNIGKSYYTSKDFLNSVSSYRAIGQFGIGFLACFMLSSRITLETKHCDTHELIRLSFDKESPYVIKHIVDDDTFEFNHGTKIIMEYNQIIPDVFANETAIESYIEDLLVVHGITLYFCDEKNKTITLRSLPGVYTNGGDAVEYDCALEESHGLINRIEWFFDDPTMVFVDLRDDEVFDSEFSEEAFASLYDIETCFESLNATFQRAEDSNAIIAGMDSHIEDYPLAELLLKYYNEIIEYYSCNDEVMGFCTEYLMSFIRDDKLTWYKIPVIVNKRIYEEFAQMCERRGLKKALLEYRQYVEYVYVITKKTDFLSTKDDTLWLQRLIDSAYISSKWEDTIDLTYFDEYLDYVQKQSMPIIRSDEMGPFIAVTKNSMKIYVRLYSKGIFVTNALLEYPYGISGLSFVEPVIVNLATDDFELDVSRNDFTKDSKERIKEQILCVLLGDIANCSVFTDETRTQIEQFLQTYYSKEYAYISEGEWCKSGVILL